MEKTICSRCGRSIDQKRWMIQVVEYLGQFGDRQPICEECHKSFQHWIEFPENDKEK